MCRGRRARGRGQGAECGAGRPFQARARDLRFSRTNFHLQQPENEFMSQSDLQAKAAEVWWRGSFCSEDVGEE